VHAAPAGSPRIFRWECSPEGEIGWVEGAPRGALIGRSLMKSASGNPDSIDPAIARAFAQRTPFREQRVSLAGAGPAAGEWTMSGDPAFDLSGRFAGYRGVAVREGAAAARASEHDLELMSPALPLDSDGLRELVHEIKTPLNAIIGFSEIIDGQYLGPAGRRYRAHAIDIAAEARVLLEAIGDLDLAAQAHRLTVSGGAPRADLASAAESAAERWQVRAEANGVELDVRTNGARLPVAGSSAFVERLAERLVDAAVELAVRGEHLALSARREGERAILTLTRPLALAGGQADPAADRALFPLRLARGMARIAGGEVRLDGEAIALELPLA
jgi:signal transduction histidine kinase